MPEWLTHEINDKALRVCDWDCAEGDGTAVLAEKFSRAKIFGVDSADTAIEQARRHHPHLEFRNEDWLQGGPPKKPLCDLLFFFHRLAHFEQPWSLLHRLSACFTRMAVFLVPFQALEPTPGDGRGVDFSDIRMKLSCDLDLALCKVIEPGATEERCSSGRQLLLVFLRSRDPLWRRITLADTVVTTSFDDKRSWTGSQRLPELESKLVSLEQQLQTARASVEDILRSKSWRITAPLRQAVERAGRVRMALRSKRRLTAASVSIQTAKRGPPPPLPVKRTPPTQLKALRVAAILDAFTQACFEPECQLVQFRPDNWEQILGESPPDFLFVESAWNGNDGAWQYRVAEYPSPPGRELLDLVAWCKRLGIPTVFWNKEDPPHFDDFIAAASCFDWIFTTDANCVPRYRERCGHDRVFPLPFAAQPAIHNPVLAGPRNNKICFAGTYYGDRFDARRGAMEVLLKPALDFDLDIYDRMHGAVGPGTENYRFPEEYRAHIIGRLEYGDMVDAYRRYRAFLNVNSVADSTTMFSRRVFELLACGTPVVSTESLGIREMFPGIVALATDTDQAHAAIEELLTDDRSWRRRAALGVRRVMQTHTYARRLRQVGETIGLTLDRDRRPSITLAVLPGPSSQSTARQLAAQTRTPDRILLVRNAQAQILARELERAGIEAPVETVDVLSHAVGQAPGVVVAFIDASHTYGPGYLDDALLALDYSGTDSTSVTEHFRLASSDGAIELVTDLGGANILSRRVKNACLVCRTDAMTSDLVDRVFSKDVIVTGEDSYARSPFEFVAGGVLGLDDERLKEITLEGVAGVGQA